MAAPEGDTAWAECLRDLKRTLEGGSVFVVGRRKRYTVRDPAKAQGDVSREACEEAFEELVRCIGFELLAQSSEAVSSGGCCRAVGCVRPEGHDGPCVDNELEELSQFRAPSKEEQDRLRDLVRRVAAHVSVAPGIQAVLAHALPPALWQPTFVICVGHGEVRVLTLAFVGNPVSGDRPTCKRTPFLLKVLTGDLASANPGPMAANYAVHAATASKLSTLAHLASLEAKLFSAMEDGGWAAIHSKELAPLRNTTQEARAAAGRSARAASMDFRPRPRSAFGQPPAAGGAEGRPAADPAAKPREIGDRATRIRATFQRAQSPTLGGAEGTAGRTMMRSRTALVMPVAQDASAAAAQGPAVSVLADGLSVKGVASAWNTVGASSSIRNFFARARSPTGTGHTQPRPKAAQHGPMDRQARMAASLTQTQMRTSLRAQPANELPAQMLAVGA